MPHSLSNAPTQLQNSSVDTASVPPMNDGKRPIDTVGTAAHSEARHKRPRDDGFLPDAWFAASGFPNYIHNMSYRRALTFGVDSTKSYFPPLARERAERNVSCPSASVLTRRSLHESLSALGS